jgi:hypothetical protein
MAVGLVIFEKNVQDMMTREELTLTNAELINELFDHECREQDITLALADIINEGGFGDMAINQNYLNMLVNSAKIRIDRGETREAVIASIRADYRAAVDAALVEQGY